jgi:hypothetical protein
VRNKEKTEILKIGIPAVLESLLYHTDHDPLPTAAEESS